MAEPFSDLMSEMTKEEVMADLIAIAKAVGLDTSAWQPGEKVWALLDLFSRWIAETWNRLVLPALRSRFIEYATGKWLDLLAWSSYDRKRFGQTYAGGDLTVENRGGQFAFINAGAMRVKNTATGKTYTNVTGGSVAAYTGGGVYPTVQLTFRADEAGTGANAAIDAIAAYPAPPVSAPVAGLYARSNDVPWLATNEETDESLRRRCVLATAALSPTGPLAAYEAACLDPRGTYERSGLTVPDDWPATVSISRVKVVDKGNASVGVYLASTSGPADGDDITPGTDVYYANAICQLLVVPAGITATVQAATAHNVPLGTAILYVRRASRVTVAEATNTAKAALDNFVATFPIGGIAKTPGGQGYLWADHVRSVLQQGPGVFSVEFSPTFADVALAVDDVVTVSYSILALVV